MQELIICRGIPASGKSTWAEMWVKAGKRRMRVSRDDLRILLFAQYTHEYETLVTSVQGEIVQAGLRRGFSVAIDDTNIKHSYVKRFAHYAFAAGIPVSLREFPISLEEALRRNAQRQGHKRIPNDVIQKMFLSYMTGTSPDLSEFNA